MGRASTDRPSGNHEAMSTLEPPHTCPFRKGRAYRVIRDDAFLNHRFTSGEEVVFTDSSYTPYDGATRYWFTSVVTGETNAWHVFDSGGPQIRLTDLFEEISN